MSDSRGPQLGVTDVKHFDLVPLSDSAGWADALTGVPHPHAHCHAHVAAFQASTGHETFLCVGFDQDDRPLVAAPLAVRGDVGEQDAYTPYGFGGFASARPVQHFSHYWQRFVASRGWVATYIFQNPLITAPSFDEPGTSQSTEIFYLDLGRPADELLRDMSSGRRRELVHWERRSDLEVIDDRAAILSFVLANATQFFRARSAASSYQFVPETWARLLASQSVQSAAVMQDGDVRAAVIFAESCGYVDYLFGFSAEGHRPHTAPLIWEMVKRYQAAGASTLNLGGGIRPNDGVAEFKRRFGALSIPSMSLHFVHRPSVYRSLCERNGIDELSTGFFPAYRRPQS